MTTKTKTPKPRTRKSVAITLTTTIWQRALGIVQHAADGTNSGRLVLQAVWLVPIKGTWVMFAADNYRIASYRIGVPVKPGKPEPIGLVIESVKGMIDMAKRDKNGQHELTLTVGPDPFRGTFADSIGNSIALFLVDGTPPDFLKVTPTRRGKAAVRISASFLAEAGAAFTKYADRKGTSMASMVDPVELELYGPFDPIVLNHGPWTEVIMPVRNRNDSTYRHWKPAPPARETGVPDADDGEVKATDASAARAA